MNFLVFSNGYYANITMGLNRTKTIPNSTDVWWNIPEEENTDVWWELSEYGNSYPYSTFSNCK